MQTGVGQRKRGECYTLRHHKRWIDSHSRQVREHLPMADALVLSDELSAALMDSIKSKNTTALAFMRRSKSVQGSQVITAFQFLSPLQVFSFSARSSSFSSSCSSSFWFQPLFHRLFLLLLHRGARNHHAKFAENSTTGFTFTFAHSALQLSQFLLAQHPGIICCETASFRRIGDEQTQT